MDGPAKIAVVCEALGDLQQAQALARDLGLPIYPNFNSASQHACEFALAFCEQQLALHSLQNLDLGPLRAEFTSGALDFRRRHDINSELLAKALGIFGEHEPLVWDATAGLGQDTWLLASLGCRVIASERNPVIFALLQNGLDAARQVNENVHANSNEEKFFHVLDRIDIKNEDGIEALQNKSALFPDVVYLDPMFPEKRKNAKAKKAMQYCQDIVGGDKDSAELLEAALQWVKYRVIVKRPKNANFLGAEKPTSQVMGKTVRYDIYALKSTKNYLDEKNNTTR